MSVLTQHSAQHSLAVHLNQPGRLVDDRSNKDYIQFINEFSRLINFYDKSNTLNGSWRPFVLKDPYFLSVLIEHANAVEKSTQFTKSCTALQALISSSEINHYPQGFNHLFHSIFQVFNEVNEWIELMQLSSIQFALKTHILESVQTIIAPLFWAFIELQKELAKPKSCLANIQLRTPVFLEKFKDSCWNLNKEKDYFYRILGQDSLLFIEDPQQILTVLIENGNYIFSYFTQFQALAVESVQTLSLEKSNFPDTLLIRTFIELLKNNQNELNGLTQKHLDFYYTDLLRQTKRIAQPDQVFVAITLGKAVASYLLSKGMLFSAGYDQNKTPIYFQSTQNQTLTSSKLNATFSLYNVPDERGNTILYLDENTKPETPLIDEDGIIKSSKIFGNPLKPKGKPVPLAIAFASPIFLLKEGQRTITIDFTFSNALSSDEFTLLKSVTSFCFSTAKDWYSVDYAIESSLLSADGLTWNIIFVLPSNAPAIEVFTKSPDTINPQWPALKLVFNALQNLTSPPIIQSISIQADVSELKNFTLSNDFGALNPSKPFQPLGPIANFNNSFYIGNAEMFSKALNSFYLAFDWDALPADFSAYYKVYNDYLAGKLIPVAKTAPKAGNLNLFEKIINKISFGIFFKNKKAAKTSSTIVDDDTDPVLFNEAFKVSFSLLNNNTWSDFVLARKTTCSSLNGTISCISPTGSTDESTIYQLFNIHSTTGQTIAPSTYYEYSTSNTGATSFPANPSLQKTSPFSLTDTTTAGFMRMSLVAPSCGFGNELYAKVISQVALVNAAAIVNTVAPATPVLIPAPNTPFAPKMSAIKGAYSAKQTFDFNYGYTVGDQSAMMQCYHYAVFEEYLIYDTSQEMTAYQNQIGIPIIGQMRNMQGLSLYPSLNFDAVLYFQLINDTHPNQASFYFELAQSPVFGNDQTYNLSFLYLSETGWFELTVLQDSTKNLTCSGLLIFEFPSDFNQSHIQMPTDSYWCAIGLKGNTLAVSETTSIQINGVELMRDGSSFLLDAEKPSLAPGLITGPATPTPQIAAVNQTYPSFGGKGAENESEKNLRVANRLKTKHRAVTIDDYKKLIAENVDGIYYSKVCFNPASRTVQIYLVKSMPDAMATNAFVPLVSNCIKTEVIEALNDSAAYGNIDVDNFKLAYLTVNTTIYINSSFELETTAQRITQALKVFLSPWITDQNNQITIDQGITDQQISEFLSQFSEISAIDAITLNISNANPTANDQDVVNRQFFYPNDPSVLLVPSTIQLLNWKVA